MPALAVAAGRQTATAVTSAGLADVVVPLVDASDVATTVVPPAGEHLVLAFCNVANDGDNNNGAEVRCDFGATTFARGGSTMRFSTFGTNVSRGSQLASAFTVTGDGSTELRLIGRGLSGGASAQCSSGSIVAVPTSDLGDFHRQESANSDAALTTPGAGWTALGTDLTFTPSEDGDYVLIACVEVFGDGTDGNADAINVRCVFGVDGSTAVVGQETFHERDSNFPAGEIRHAYRWVAERPLLAANTYRLSLEEEGTAANGNFPGRRVRFFAFRSDSVRVYSGASTGGISVTASTGPFALPGLSIAVPDPVDAGVVHSYLGQTEAQTTQFGDFRLVQGAANHPPNGTFRGVDNNGTGAGDDITLIPLQSHEVLAPGSAYTVTGEFVTYGSGDFNVGMARGGGSFVPAEFVVIAWQSPASADITADFGGSDQSFEATVSQGVSVAATFNGGGGGTIDLDLLEQPSGTFGEADASLSITLDFAFVVAGSFGGSAQSLQTTVSQGFALTGAFGGSNASLSVSVEQGFQVTTDFGGSAQSLSASVELALPITATFGGSDESFDANVSGLVGVVATGLVVTTDTTRPAHTRSREGMGQPWYVNPEDEGSTLSELAAYPAVMDDRNRTVETPESPIDLSSVTSVGLQVWDGSAWADVAGTGSVASEVLTATSEREAGTYWRLSFTPAAGALAALAASIGYEDHPRRWSLEVPGGDLHFPSRGYDVLYLNPPPS